MLSLEKLADLLAPYRDIAKTPVTSFSINGVPFDFNQSSAIMGVINLSADSWYRESVCLTPDMAIRRGHVLKAQGADLVDIGAESTVAHAERVDEAMQASRLLPVLHKLANAGITLSVETYHPSVALASLKAGAHVINLTGTDQLEEVLRIAADYDAAVILCYVQGGNVREVGEFDFSKDPVKQMYNAFARQIETASRLGVEKLFLDPGLGFYYRNLQDSAARVHHQTQVFLSSFRLRSLGFPIAHALPHAFEFFGEEVRTAEGYFTVLAALGKTDLFRTHEVPKVKAILDSLKVG